MLQPVEKEKNLSNIVMNYDPSSVPLLDNAWNQVRLQVEGRRLIVLLNGSAVFECPRNDRNPAEDGGCTDNQRKRFCCHL